MSFSQIVALYFWFLAQKYKRETIIFLNLSIGNLEEPCSDDLDDTPAKKHGIKDKARKKPNVWSENKISLKKSWKIVFKRIFQNYLIITRYMVLILDSELLQGVENTKNNCDFVWFFFASDSRRLSYKRS